MNQGLISRRYFLGECGIGLGKIAAASLLSNNLAGRSLEPKPAHSQPKAKAVMEINVTPSFNPMPRSLGHSLNLKHTVKPEQLLAHLSPPSAPLPMIYVSSNPAPPINSITLLPNFF